MMNDRLGLLSNKAVRKFCPDLDPDCVRAFKDPVERLRLHKGTTEYDTRASAVHDDYRSMYQALKKPLVSFAKYTSSKDAKASARLRAMHEFKSHRWSPEHPVRTPAIPEASPKPREAKPRGAKPREIIERLYSDRPARIRALMRSVASIGANGCMRSVPSNDGRVMTTVVNTNDKNHRIDLAYMGGDMLGFGAVGVAYVSVSMTMIPSVIKLGPRNPQAREEAILGMRLAQGVINGRCPNIACTVGYFECDKPLEGLELPRMFKSINPGAFKKQYSVTVMELLEGGTVQDLFDGGVDLNGYISVILQSLLSIRYMHASGYSHGDNHSSNYFINPVDPGGRWHYRISNVDIFVPNYGFQVVLGDFGLAKPLTAVNETKDIEKVFDLQVNAFSDIRKRVLSFMAGLKQAATGTRADLVIMAFAQMTKVVNNRGDAQNVLNCSGGCINQVPYTCEP